MSFLLRNIARYAAQKLASDPRARETAAKVASVVVGEASQIARGVFGSPSYVFDGEVFWGQDRLDFLDRALAAI